ncbi:MAG TPA: alpha/beta fold hydrolase [Burkholderiaceae bacterium]|nr:alpha/beta fold hydrolase [Burkholderiaceae bacterium]
MPFPSNALAAAPLHAVTAGAGPTVVCLHSSGSSSGQWRRLIESAQADYSFVAFDLHGHGRSPDYAGDRYALRSESDAVLQGLPLSNAPVHLVGHSYGGAVAIDLAVRHPGRFASVTVFEPVLFALLDRASAEFGEITSVGFDIIGAARAGELRAASAIFIDYWNGTGAWRGLPVEQQERVRARIHAIARHFEALFADPLPLERLRALRVPTRVLLGDRSPAPARAVGRHLGALSFVTTEVLPGLAHMGPVTHPALVNALITGHLETFSTLRIAA